MSLYAGSMSEENQAPIGPESGSTSEPRTPAFPESDPAPIEPDAEAGPESPLVAGEPAGGASPPAAPPLGAGFLEPEMADLLRGVGVWFLVLAFFGAVGLLFNMQEMAGLTAIAGLFVASQAADLNPRWNLFYYLTAWIVPVCGAAAALALAYQIHLQGTAQVIVIGLCAAAALISLLLLVRPVADRLVAAFMAEPPSHSLRLVIRLAVLTLLLSAPSWFALRELFGWQLEDTGPIFQHGSLAGQLFGYIILALASVGFLLRRDLRRTLDRLGIQPLAQSHLAVIAIGVIAFFGLNVGADWFQRAFLPELWQSDHRVNQAIAAGLGPGRVLLLGMSAGIGEEITVRGALQPKLGLVTTSLVFAALHVQYSWFGMLVVFLLGLMLGTIRIKANTTAAIAVHVIYDVLAVFSV